MDIEIKQDQTQHLNKTMEHWKGETAQLSYYRFKFALRNNNRLPHLPLRLDSGVLLLSPYLVVYAGVLIKYGHK